MFGTIKFTVSAQVKPQVALQSAQHTTPSVLRPSDQLKKSSPQKTFNGEKTGCQIKNVFMGQILDILSAMVLIPKWLFKHRNCSWRWSFFFFLRQLTFTHQVGWHEGIIEYESQSRLWFALALFSYAVLSDPEQLLAIRCHVCVLIHMTLTFWGHFLQLIQLCSPNHLFCVFRQKRSTVFLVWTLHSKRLPRD